MSKKHTPGPLVVKTDGGGFFWVDKETKDGGFTVCNTGDGIKAEANAILYAAAPDLLEALKNMVIYYGGMATDASIDAEALNAVVQAEAAIAQARENK